MGNSIYCCLVGSGTVTPAIIILHGLVDDFGTFITPPELSYDTYVSRYNYFTGNEA